MMGRIVLFTLLLSVALLTPLSAWATTYFVATTGSDANNGTTVGTPFRNPQKCVNVMVPGDTCTVADGTYSPTSTQGISNQVVRISVSDANCVPCSAVDGTSGNRITLKSTNQYGAKLLLSNALGGNAGIAVWRQYWTIDGFEILATVPSNTDTTQTGVEIHRLGVTVKNTKIHDIAKNACSNSVNGNSGMYIGGPDGAASITLDRNTIFSVGRRYNGESGCATTIAPTNDHGFYIDGTNTITVTRNLFYDVVRGWPIHVYSSTGTTTSNLNLYNNTMADKLVGVSGGPDGHILIHRTIVNANIQNNISYHANIGMLRCYAGTSFTNILVDHNLSDTPTKVAPCINNDAGVTTTNNLANNASINFTNPGARDYTLQATSSAIDAGVNVGLPFTGSAPDMGYVEFGGDITPPAPPTGVRILP